MISQEGWASLIFFWLPPAASHEPLHFGAATVQYTPHGEQAASHCGDEPGAVVALEA
jgi:hypothetical protein